MQGRDGSRIMTTEKQKRAWLRTKLKNFQYMIDKRPIMESKEKLWDIYSELTDKIFDGNLEDKG